MVWVTLVYLAWWQFILQCCYWARVWTLLPYGISSGKQFVNVSEIYLKQVRDAWVIHPPPGFVLIYILNYKMAVLLLLSRYIYITISRNLGRHILQKLIRYNHSKYIFLEAKRRRMNKCNVAVNKHKCPCIKNLLI